MAGNPKTITTSSDTKIIKESEQRAPCNDRSITPDLDFNDSSDLNNITTPIDTDLPQNNQEPSSSSSTRKRSANEEANLDPNKKIKPDPDAQVDQNVNQLSTLFLFKIKPDPDAPIHQNTVQPSTVIPIIKPDPDAPVDQNTVQPSTVIPFIKPDPDGLSSSTSSTSATTTTVKIEPAVTDNNASSSSSPVTSTTTVRIVCQFGIRCYRHHEDHRREMAHPGDMDYRRPDFIPAPDTAPDCEFGAGCYRRNPQHFRGNFIQLSYESNN